MSTKATHIAGAAPSESARIFRWAIAAMAAIGLASRALPLFGDQTRLLRQFPTEDGYLMLTIARNMSLGHGMSTAAGTMPTNGTQPLMTAVYSVGFSLFNNDRVAGVTFALLVQLLLALLGAWLLFDLGRHVLEDCSHGARVAALAASAWFASGISVRHSMNCLETGAFAAAVLLFSRMFLAKADALEPWSFRRSIGLGALLGVLLWIRLDAVFLVLAACLVRLLIGPGSRLAPTRRQLLSAIWMGATAVVFISPWLFYNQSNFGSIMPVSGRAESGFASVGGNLSLLPVVLVEYFLAVVPMPARFESHPLVVCASLGIVAVSIWQCVRFAVHGTPRVRALIALMLLYALGLCTYYGAFFGAQYFLTRYMFPLSAFAALMWAGAVDVLLTKRPSRLLSSAFAAGVVVLSAFAALRTYRHGREHMHFQVVEWIERNVDERTWVGAIQTGTIGFYHDRTINLDGKVNPEAYAAVHQGRIPQYVLAQPIRYLADWEGIASWALLPEMMGRFEVIVDDPVANLGVLRRRDGQ